MGSSYQTILATGPLTDVRAAVAGSGQDAVIMQVGAARWSVVPHQEQGYAATDDLARLLSAPDGAVAAAFSVFDAESLVAGLFRGGRAYHDYLDDQAAVEHDPDEDVLVDGLGRVYPRDAELPTGPYGADPAAFAPLAPGPVDLAALGAVLHAPGMPADRRHRELLRLLGVEPGPVQMTYDEAIASGLAA